MPLLLNALRNATGADSRNLRVKVLECAGFIGFVVFTLYRWLVTYLIWHSCYRRLGHFPPGRWHISTVDDPDAGRMRYVHPLQFLVGWIPHI